MSEPAATAVSTALHDGAGDTQRHDDQEATNASVARATGVIALGNVASRILGMARDVVLTNLFGASTATDAFFVATLVPRTLYDLLIGGHVNGALIPVLSEVVTRDGRQALWRLVSVLVSMIAVVMALIVLLLTIFAPTVVSLVGSGYDDATRNLAADLLRITAPAMLFLSLFAILSGTLYALRAFTFPALAGAIFNGCVVLGTVMLAPPLQVFPAASSHGVTWLIDRPIEGIRAAAFGWLIGAGVQMASQLPGLRRARLRLTLHWRHPAIRQIVLLYLPVTFSLILDAFVRVFSYNLASQTGESSLSYMNWATTLIQFPQGLVATAISIAILPTLSRQAALIAGEGERSFRDTLGLGLRMAITLIIPAAVGLFVLAVPIIDLLFEHGAFTPADTDVTALALRLYLIGLPFAAVDLLLVYAFYARQDTLTPALIGLVSLLLYMVVALLLAPTTGVFSLMIADSVKHVAHALLSTLILHRKLGGFGDQRLALTTLKAAAAAAVMVVGALIIQPVVVDNIDTKRFYGEIFLVGAAGSVCVVVYVAMALLLRLEELLWLWRMIRQRLFSRA
ncbi:MAG: murein biosynthesis integral membrane protein MurJ [Anaerolineae bacterium]|nr:murein biosynthesis integral membrane protein MurJ [Anaerolineae bacterium]NUQ05223.1 murein biosynthesis integral membrane protein MurJ [Anaerolineae bacterium]